MNRRALIAGVGTALLALTGLVGSAQAAPGDDDLGDGKVYTGLAKLFADLLGSVEQIAAPIDRARLRRALADLDDTLIDLLTDKRTVAADLGAQTCSGLVDLRISLKAAQHIQELMAPLRTRTKDLATAITPPALKAQASALADSLSGVTAGKPVWVFNVGSYCTMTTAGRAAFLAQVTRSAVQVAASRQDLAKLIAGLG
ncbi:hypothetical protein [Phenylobacterium aquaticum]|uniref:hypothetical protein n=1 Tax=Phenylobacterium aquaticum TaxID=1763816 RepID=UPI001F5C2247|nr:hypothetical protein [Phenylobacterium aquaticum]MCI3132443.1 hypothetical protein [Phenylobacterium aquaticum]